MRELIGICWNKIKRIEVFINNLDTKQERKFKIAILGANGIGKVHARNFNKLNVEIIALLSSSLASGKASSDALRELLGLKVNYYENLDILIEESDPDAVVISTPNELHYDQILKVLSKKIPIFCEKPLFWNKQDNYETFLKKLETISDHPNRVIFVNTSAAAYIKSIETLLPNSKDIYSFNFKFVTQGNNKFTSIAEDLLPHGLSLIIELFGCHEISLFNEEYSETTYKCNFEYSGCAVNFEFQEGKLFKKEFIFKVNETEFVRAQKESFNDYQVFLKCAALNKKIKIDDPFVAYASSFIDFCQNKPSIQKEIFFESSHNLSLMAKILLKKI